MAGEQGIWDIEGDINIPLSDKWALRAFAFTREDDGFMTNPGSLSPVFGVDYNQPEDVGALRAIRRAIGPGGDISDRCQHHCIGPIQRIRWSGEQLGREMGTPRQYPVSIHSWIPTSTRLTKERHLAPALRSMPNSTISTSKASPLIPIPKVIGILMSI